MNTFDLWENTWEYRINAISVISEMIQLLAIQGAPMPNSARPIMAMVGPMTIGLMILRTWPIIPVYPSTISTTDAIIMAPAIFWI